MKYPAWPMQDMRYLLVDRDGERYGRSHAFQNSISAWSAWQRAHLESMRA